MENNLEQSNLTVDVAIVGGGTAGLALACRLKKIGLSDVVVLERETNAGGVPRHCGHYPFGLREYKRPMKGTDYAAKNVALALEAGVRIETSTTVTALNPAGHLSLSTPSGNKTLSAKRVVLCTGVRESSRAQRFISGDRPLGVITTGALQAMTYLEGLKPFSNPIILGSELVSVSAIQTCQHLGIKPVAMVEEQDDINARSFVKPYLKLKGVALYTGAKEITIKGQNRVEALEFINQHGKLQRLDADGIIISGRFRPEAALLYQSHLSVDSGTGGPSVDQFGRCSDPTYFCAGNLLRAAETSSWCWHEGVKTADYIAHDLNVSADETIKIIPFEIAHEGIKFIMPQNLSLNNPLQKSSLMGNDKLRVELTRPFKGHLNAMDGETIIWRQRIHSKPVRRIDLPLNELQVLIKDKPIEKIRFTLSEDK